MHVIPSYNRGQPTDNPFIRMETTALRYEQGMYVPLMMHPTALLRHMMSLRLRIREIETENDPYGILDEKTEELGFLHSLRQEFSLFPKESVYRAKRSCLEFAGVGLLAETMEKTNNRIGSAYGKENADHVLKEVRKAIRDPNIEEAASEILHHAMTHRDVMQSDITAREVMKYARERMKYLLTH